MNVVSVKGGKVHLEDSGSPVAFPLCNSGSRNTYTKFRHTDQDVTCKECAGILERRTARLAREAEEAAQDAEQTHNEEELVETMELTTPKGIRFAAGEAGREAANAYADLMAERMAVPAVDIRKGDHIRPAPDGPWYPVTADARRSHMRGHVFIRSGQYLFTRPVGAKVVRHHMETSLQVMRDVADQYPGASLELPEPAVESKVAPSLSEPQAKALVETYLGRGRTDNSGVSVGTWAHLESLSLAFLDPDTPRVGITDRGRDLIATGAVDLLDGEGYRFRMETVRVIGAGAMVTVRDWETGETPEVTSTWFASEVDANVFVKETVGALMTDGYKEVAQ
ncbi:hypothetical protein HOS57_gp51 [Streptomyces phage AbbeyMikolon]|uniref:Uncharacterized protein n=1 Tax=Streptomyces phage AbbeyMikolon TaxID=2059880 RepID=A0A2H5BLD5_9CAUD|nr:hypothetical protein HOS57_gp51 [Streptomyces phage AbbeyMikolon]AUG87122.1 hypothetical protein SEA_ABBEYMIKOLON_51 [Streptomyces phage AbbeyMikolon]